VRGRGRTALHGSDGVGLATCRAVGLAKAEAGQRSTNQFSLLTSHILVHGSAMGSEDEPDHSDQDGITIGAIVLAAIPFLALILGPFIANRLEPRIFGLPFLLAYCVFWVLLTPVFLFWVDRLRKRR
jgi:hypothetical protein